MINNIAGNNNTYTLKTLFTKGINYLDQLSNKLFDQDIYSYDNQLYSDSEYESDTEEQSDSSIEQAYNSNIIVFDFDKINSDINIESLISNKENQVQECYCSYEDIMNKKCCYVCENKINHRKLEKFYENLNQHRFYKLIINMGSLIARIIFQYTLVLLVLYTFSFLKNISNIRDTDSNC